MWRKSRRLASSQPCETETKSECDKRDKQRFPGLRSIENNLERVCGLELKDLSSFSRLTELLYRPTDPASLGVIRALFGEIFLTLSFLFNLIRDGRLRNFCRGIIDIERS